MLTRTEIMVISVRRGKGNDRYILYRGLMHTVTLKVIPTVFIIWLAMAGHGHRGQ